MIIADRDGQTAASSANSGSIAALFAAPFAESLDFSVESAIVRPLSWAILKAIQLGSPSCFPSRFFPLSSAIIFDSGTGSDVLIQSAQPGGGATLSFAGSTASDTLIANSGSTRSHANRRCNPGRIRFAGHSGLDLTRLRAAR